MINNRSAVVVEAPSGDVQSASDTAKRLNQAAGWGQGWRVRMGSTLASEAIMKAVDGCGQTR